MKLSKATIKKAAKRAEKNWNERKKILDDVDDMIYKNDLEREILKFDRTFCRKLRNYSADITTTRIAKVMNKLVELS